VSDRATAAEEKRRLLLAAAVRVFARQGYHTSRVGDIAKEAQVAHGLLYHYFASKEEVLETVFRETWAQMLETTRSIEQAGGPAGDQIRRVAEVILRTWRRDPDLVRVLVREVTRSPQLQREVEEVGHAVDALERIIRHGQERGEFRSGLDPRLASLVVYGAIEQILTSWVLGPPPASDAELERAERTVVELLVEGLVAAEAPAPA
jgi:TetR/AcrR family transcriptional regulator, fatty acid metabolism regulator protein